LGRPVEGGICAIYKFADRAADGQACML